MDQLIKLFIVIPFISGIVGYATNALAIKMMFRPFRAHWYTFGWQGIIPRTRGALAANMGRVIGEKLVTTEELDKTMSSPEFLIRLKDSLRATFITDDESEDSKLLKLYDRLLSPFLIEMLNDESLQSSINSFFTNTLHKAVGYGCGIRRDTMITILSSLPANEQTVAVKEKIADYLAMYIRNDINNIVNSGKSVGDIFKININTDALADKGLLAVNKAIIDIFSDEEVAKSVAKILAERKNEMFDSSVKGVLKLGLINTIFSDNKLSEIVHGNMPSIGVNITTDEAIQARLHDKISAEIKSIIETPISDFITNIEPAVYHAGVNSLSTMLAVKIIPDRLIPKIIHMLENHNDDGGTICDFLAEIDVDIYSLIPAELPVSAILLNIDISKLKKVAGGGITVSEKNIDDVLTLSANMIASVIRMILPRFLNVINIAAIVEDKVNSLDLAEVEDILFSFMKSHFKWINLLGFILGFLLGLVQLAYMYLSGNIAQL